MGTNKISSLIFWIPFHLLTNISLYSQEVQDSSILNAYKRLPVLNNFRFMPTEVIRDPFINTFVKINMGAGAALDLNSYVKDLQGNVLDTLSGDVAYISGELEFQYALNNWLAFNASYGGYARVGKNTYTILTSGISYSTGFTLGGKIRIWYSEKMLLSGSIDYTLNNVFLYSVYDFVKKVYNSGGMVDSAKYSLLENEELPETFLNLNFAYSPTDYFGVLSIAGFGVGKTFKSKSKGNVRFGAAASVDFLNVGFINFPIGILGCVKYNSYPESGEDVKNLFTYGTRISYTGHKDFDIGIENTYQTLKYNKNDQNINTILTEFKILYYF